MQSFLEDRQVARSRHALRSGVFCGAVVVALFAGCSKNDAISRAEKEALLGDGLRFGDAGLGR
jgi:hypothetical protein